ncbi:MAG: hypothetical protein IID38_06085 [Planctomycetes bacterium]|nr:hypothetical protein [Planctomycetota bacterium]
MKNKCGLVMGILATVTMLSNAWATEPRACCCPDGTCTDVSKPTCFEIGGDAQTSGLLCADITECPPTWACDLTDGKCENKSFDHCDGVGGTWHEGEVCDGTTCGGGEEEPGLCRITGGGVDCFDSTFVSGECSMASGKAKKLQGFDVYTFGGQCGAPGSPFGEWTHANHSDPKWTFHAGTHSAPPETVFQVVECSGEVCPKAAANGVNSKIICEGVGSFKSGDPPALDDPSSNLNAVTVRIADWGEPGKSGKQGPASRCPDNGFDGANALDDCGCPDWYHIAIHANEDPASPVIYEVDGYITGGNLQMHSSLD